MPAPPPPDREVTAADVRTGGGGGADAFAELVRRCASDVSALRAVLASVTTDAGDEDARLRAAVPPTGEARGVGRAATAGAADATVARARFDALETRLNAAEQRLRHLECVALSGAPPAPFS